VLEPGIFEEETTRGGNGGGDGNKERDMIGCGARTRGEGGVWEGLVPGIVEQSSIQTCQGGGVLAVGPGETAIRERKLVQEKIVYHFVEGRRKVDIKV
jgi:hypothetical protein